MISDATVRELAAHRGDPAVASLYLDVDGRRRPRQVQYRDAFERLAEGLRRRARTRDGERGAREAERDLAQMRAWLGRDLDRTDTRGVAFFSCASQGFFRAVTLPRAVRDEAAFDPAPHLRQLVTLLDEHERFLVALVDRRRLRLFRFELGEATEMPAVLDLEPRALDTSVELGSFERYTEEAERIHLRRAAAAVTDALEEWPTHRLILAGVDHAVAGLEHHLPKAVARKIVGRTTVPVTASPQEVAAVALEVEAAVERLQEAEAVEDLRQRAASDRDAVVGLPATLAALAERRVATLFVSEGFAAPGARCPACGHLGVDLRLCPRCDARNVEVEDVVELAIDEALTQGAAVELCRSTDLDHFGRIGAIERY